MLENVKIHFVYDVQGSSLEWDVKLLNKDDQITFQRDELYSLDDCIITRVFLACGEVELYGEDHDVYKQSFTLLNLLPYLLNDKRNMITVSIIRGYIHSIV